MKLFVVFEFTAILFHMFDFPIEFGNQFIVYLHSYNLFQIGNLEFHKLADMYKDDMISLLKGLRNIN